MNELLAMLPGGYGPSLSSVVHQLLVIANWLIPLIIGIALIGYFRGVTLYGVFRADSDEGKTKAKQTILWGVIAIFVMVSVWGILRILLDTFLL